MIEGISGSNKGGKEKSSFKIPITWVGEEKKTDFKYSNRYLQENNNNNSNKKKRITKRKENSYKKICLFLFLWLTSMAVCI